MISILFQFSREVKLIEKNLKRLQVESDKRDAKLYTNIFGRATKVNIVFYVSSALNNFGDNIVTEIGHHGPS